VFEPAVVAFHTKKTVIEYSASKVFAEFVVNERWQRNVRIGKMRLEYREVILNDFV